MLLKRILKKVLIYLAHRQAQKQDLNSLIIKDL